jgi:hypothetical protein
MKSLCGAMQMHTDHHSNETTRLHSDFDKVTKETSTRTVSSVPLYGHSGVPVVTH